MKTTRILAAMGLLFGLAMNQVHAADTGGIGRTEVVRHDIGAIGREAVQVRVDFAPGAAFPKHVHPGEEVAYVLEGTMEYQLNEQPPVKLKAGEALFIPAGAVHSAKNIGSGNAAELATYIVEKGKPIVVTK